MENFKSTYIPLRKNPGPSPFQKGDNLVLFGELFSRGYANGLVDEAEKRGMNIIYSTVGRREKDQTLRALNADEINKPLQNFINIPLEAGFDLYDLNGWRPVNDLEGVKLSEWENVKIQWDKVEEARKKARADFADRVSKYVAELEKKIDLSKNTLIAHTMAGGVPRTKIVMPLMNRVFKGTGDRYMPSETFWNSEIGKFSALSFLEVTAYTYETLLKATADLREKALNRGGNISYVAYGYHGTEVTVDGKYEWQSYAPYLQGWAKVELEKVSDQYFDQGVRTCVFNCPEILTNSSSIFQGVEVPLYPLLFALEKQGNPEFKKVWAQCQERLKEGVTVKDIVQISDTFLKSPEAKSVSNFQQWPMHSNASQLEKLINTSDELRALHKDEKLLITEFLSEFVFDRCGILMMNEGFKPEAPYCWLNHDVLASI